MADVGEVARLVTAALDAMGNAVAALEQAHDQAKEAHSDLVKAWQGRTADDAIQAEELVGGVPADATALAEQVRKTMKDLTSYRASLTGAPPPADGQPGTETTRGAHTRPAADDAARKTTPDEPERVTAARAALPPPVERGQKTHGRWFANGSTEPDREIVSGKHDANPDDPDDVSYETAQAHLTRLGFNRLAIASHVETRLAVRMARTELREVTVTINHVPCPGPFGCDTVLPAVLPPGKTLTVYGVKADGTYVVNRYTGAPE
ncbi:DddA-like double-stranded DNA deaminase toxin [Amycolatopsis sp. NPDC059021]|uniref:DddA-like double-stranded DNA deaminase toxin n=1 Tax=Amycolatopsis sp. NPDC059021 TaxID=3346704 RepID=UPI003670B61F